MIYELSSQSLLGVELITGGQSQQFGCLRCKQDAGTYIQNFGPQNHEAATR